MRKRILTLLLIGFGLWLIVSFTRDLWDLYQKSKEIGKEQLKVEELEKENLNLKRRLAEVKSPEFIEKEAREKLGLVKEGEAIIILPEEKEEISQESKEEDLENWQRWLKLFF